MPPLKGLTSLYGDPKDTGSFMDEGVLEARASPTNPAHGQYGDLPFRNFGGTAGPELSHGTAYDAGYDDPGYCHFGFPEPGEVQDQTPTTHSSPYPRGIIQIGSASLSTPGGLEIVAEQMSQVHRPEMGASRVFSGDEITGREESTDYTTDRYDAPNDTMQARVDGQLRMPYLGAGGQGGKGGADPVQGYGALNSIPEFQAGHSIRRVQHDRMPWDFTATHGEQDVPFFGRHPVYQATFDGPDSPYYDAGNTRLGAQIPWEGRIGNPSPYEQPAEPTFASYSPAQIEDVFAW
jgi:hypothetical protein